MEYSNNELESEFAKCQQKLEQLKLENEELTQNLFHVNEKLVDSEKLKGHFISNVTNEIVNPFTSIMALAGNIGQLKEGDMNKVHRMAGLIYEEAFHLDFQLKNIFSAALIEAGLDGLNLTEVNINEITELIIEYFQGQLDKNSIGISVNYSNLSSPDTPIVIISDWDKLDLILKNIISNSIKFSPVNSVIELDFILNEGILTIKVSDFGKGISEEDLLIIYDRFKQLDEKINSINTGHGLGLSVVQAYVDMLQGEISIDKKLEGGVQVVVVLPELEQTNDWQDLDDFLLDSDTSF